MNMNIQKLHKHKKYYMSLISWEYMNKYVTRFGKLSLHQSPGRQTYYHTLFSKGRFNQTKTRVDFSQETTYCKLFSAILRQWNRNWMTRRSKPVEYELVSQNCVSRTFPSTVMNMTQSQMDMTNGYDAKEQMDTTEKRSVENNKNQWTKRKEGSPFLDFWE